MSLTFLSDGAQDAHRALTELNTRFPGQWMTPDDVADQLRRCDSDEIEEWLHELCDEGHAESDDNHDQWSPWLRVYRVKGGAA